jgi:hypothetical protein
MGVTTSESYLIDILLVHNNRWFGDREATLSGMSFFWMYPGQPDAIRGDAREPP